MTRNSPTCRGPGSCIGSTRIRADCCWSRAHCRRTRPSWPRSRHGRSSASIWRWCGASRSAAAVSMRRSGAARSCAPAWRCVPAGVPRSRTIASSGASQDRRCCACNSRPDAPIRSAFTWRTSAFRSSGIHSTAGAARSHRRRCGRRCRAFIARRCMRSVCSYITPPAAQLLRFEAPLPSDFAALLSVLERP